MVNMKFMVVGCLVLVVLYVHTSNAEITKVRSLQKQCVDQGFAGVCSISTKNPTGSRRCSQTLQCAVVKGKNTFKQPAGRIPDGTHCGDKKICVNRRCTAVEHMPTVVGSESSKKCKKLVPRADRITPTPLEPLSP